MNVKVQSVSESWHMSPLSESYTEVTKYLLEGQLKPKNEAALSTPECFCCNGVLFRHADAKILHLIVHYRCDLVKILTRFTKETETWCSLEWESNKLIWNTAIISVTQYLFGFLDLLAYLEFHFSSPSAVTIVNFLVVVSELRLFSGLGY